MRSWNLALFFAVLLLSACELTGTSSSEQSPPPLSKDPVRQAYLEDAHQLVVRRMVRQNDHSVEIPEDRVQSFHDALMAVYTASDIPARDSILGIHAVPRHSLHAINVGVRESAKWTEAWQNEQRLTGYAPIDKLLKEYDLTVERYLDFGDTGTVTLRSNSPVNTVGLSKKFDGIGGVRYAESNGLVGSGDNIKANVQHGFIRLDYIRAWGDCSSGCIHQKSWTFTVEADGAVTYEGATSK
jgi:hypothetical protein